MSLVRLISHVQMEVRQLVRLDLQSDRAVRRVAEIGPVNGVKAYLKSS
jgi:hypothetical protein